MYQISRWAVWQTHRNIVNCSSGRWRCRWGCGQCWDWLVYPAVAAIHPPVARHGSRGFSRTLNTDPYPWEAIWYPAGMVILVFVSPDTAPNTANYTHSFNDGLMLGQRRRRWPDIGPSLGQRPVFRWAQHPPTHAVTNCPEHVQDPQK